MYEVMSKEIAHLFTDRFVSPLGEDHKLRKLQLIDPEDSRKLTKAAKAGRISYRETLLGGCMKRGSCPFGRIDNIIHCGGGDTGMSFEVRIRCQLRADVKGSSRRFPDVD